MEITLIFQSKCFSFNSIFEYLKMLENSEFIKLRTY